MNHNHRFLRSRFQNLSFVLRRKVMLSLTSFCHSISFDIHRVVLKENIKKSQRIEEFRILTVHDGSEKCIFEGTVVGYKKIALLDEIKTKELIKELVIEIIDSRVAPTLSYIGIFE